MHGADPNVMVKDGEPPREQEYNAYIGALCEQKGIMERLDEKRMGKLPKAKREKLEEKLKQLREINTYLSQKMRTTNPDGEHTFMDIGYPKKNDER